MRFKVLIIALTALTVNVFCQSGNVTLISGNLKEANNLPDATKICFVDDSGNKNCVRSNSKNFSFKDIKEKKKIKVGNKTKLVTVTSKEQLIQQVLESRKQAIQQLFVSLGISGNSYDIYFDMNSSKAFANNNLSVKIAKIISLN